MTKNREKIPEQKLEGLKTWVYFVRLEKYFWMNVFVVSDRLDHGLGDKE